MYLTPSVRECTCVTSTNCSVMSLTKTKSMSRLMRKRPSWPASDHVRGGSRKATSYGVSSAVYRSASVVTTSHSAIGVRHRPLRGSMMYHGTFLTIDFAERYVASLAFELVRLGSGEMRHRWPIGLLFFGPSRESAVGAGTRDAQANRLPLTGVLPDGGVLPSSE